MRSGDQFIALEGCDMTEKLAKRVGSHSPAAYDNAVLHTAAECEREELARLRALLRQKHHLIEQQNLAAKEAEHRMLNDLQIVASLLAAQGRASGNAVVVSQLAVAASRVVTIERIHRRLHSHDGAQRIAFKRYLEDLCCEFSTLFSEDRTREQMISVEGIEADLPAVTGISLGFIVNELVTNAIKYGAGHVMVRLEPQTSGGYALSVSNDGHALPEGFEPAATKGLGMKIIRSLVERIGGELRVGLGDNGQGSRFTVLFQ
ncbi:sensor histidine kinase [Allomesorhizobium alhagi]|uniref:sensor histidine kinase n=1 Tax=Allomesorhizobium alhagi TaxID=475067 RepID=UPI0011120122|nr:sensor histidine kinase [Mesorhizobium alhagi]